jgi:hypothetical protein
MLVEVVTSIVLFVIAFFAFADIVFIQQYSISYARHKLQAIYAARAVLDSERVAGFPYIVSQSFTPPTYVGCNLPGAAITVTVLSPHNDAAMTYRKTVRVKVSWKEAGWYGAPKTKYEYLTTDIANDSQLN